MKSNSAKANGIKYNLEAYFLPDTVIPSYEGQLIKIPPSVLPEDGAIITIEIP